MFPIPMNFPVAVLPLSWIGEKRRPRVGTKCYPTQFATRKNAPGKTTFKVMEPLKLSDPDVNIEEPATTPGPEETNDGDFKNKVLIIDDGRATTLLRAAVQTGLESGSVEVPKL